MPKDTTLKIPQNLREPLIEEKKEQLKNIQPMNYVCHHEIFPKLELEKESKIYRYLKKLFKYR